MSDDCIFFTALIFDENFLKMYKLGIDVIVVHLGVKKYFLIISGNYRVHHGSLFQNIFRAKCFSDMVKMVKNMLILAFFEMKFGYV